ncbi:MAG TPA: DUF4489 domain-containing protein [Syntrophomonadaceae bacterium]|nr:DUF4489 domain-containing protein [Syntrophomonadaceae bacterium]
MRQHRQPCDSPDCSPEYEHKHHENKIVLNCGTGTGVSLPVSSAAPLCQSDLVVGTVRSAVPLWQPGLVVGTVTLDTRGFKKPTVKIDYSSVVSFRAGSFNFELEITFQLSRSCDNGPKIPLATWTYEREVESDFTSSAEIEFKDPIAFTWCECHDCLGCCTYFVEVISIDAEDIESASITNVGINALAIG